MGSVYIKQNAHFYCGAQKFTSAHCTRTCAVFQKYAMLKCFVFLRFCWSSIRSSGCKILVVSFCLLGSRIGWTTSVLVFTALHLLSCLQLRFQCISHPKSNLLCCQTSQLRRNIFSPFNDWN